MITLLEKQTWFKQAEWNKAYAAVRKETLAEMLKRLRLGWDWRNGGRAARDAAKAA